MTTIPKRTPFMKYWEFVSYKDNGGMENRKSFIKALTEFIHNEDEELDFSAITYVDGRVYGREGFKDGDWIDTSRVVKIQKIKPDVSSDDLAAGKCSMEEFDAKMAQLFCITTQSGSNYYLYERDMSPHMTLALGDFYHVGKVFARFLQR